MSTTTDTRNTPSESLKIAPNIAPHPMRNTWVGTITGMSTSRWSRRRISTERAYIGSSLIETGARVGTTNAAATYAARTPSTIQLARACDAAERSEPDHERAGWGDRGPASPRTSESIAGAEPSSVIGVPPSPWSRGLGTGTVHRERGARTAHPRGAAQHYPAVPGPIPAPRPVWRP